MEIAAFSKYLSYNVGGAELSTISLLNSQEKASVSIYSFDKARFEGVGCKYANLPSKWKNAYLTNMYQFKGFWQIEYLLNRKRIMHFFANIEADELWTYGTYAPAASMTFKKDVKYFVRSESDLGIYENYYSGYKKYLKKIYNIGIAPATDVYKVDLYNTINNANVVVNSNYMASRTYDIFKVDSEVIYPEVNVDEYKRQIDLVGKDSKWIVFIGDSDVKGLSLVIRLAEAIPQLQFRIVSRFVRTPYMTSNIWWTPWESDVWKVYQSAAAVLVPSQWEEAYGRVSREAYLLGIPLLVSCVGGLPETVDFKNEYLVKDYKSCSAWHSAINALDL